MTSMFAPFSSAARGWVGVTCRLLLLGLLLLASQAFANDPGGGTNNVGANVTLASTSTTVTVANGTLTATITKANAKVTSLLYRGRQMVVGDIYFSMDGSSSYEQPANGVYWIKTNTADMVDVGFRCTMKTAHYFDLDIHYVLRRGDTGLYVYSILSHATNYPATSYGEWRMVWKMDQDPLERIYVDEIRNWQKPSAYDLAHAEATGIAEIVKLTTGPWAGRYDCKYTYNVEYEKLGCYGHASNTNKIGAWMVIGGYDYFNDGPLKSDLAPASGINHIHFGRNHYAGSGLTLATNEAWSKLYGPYLLYCNTNALGADACWADAKTQVEAEKSAWPYEWLTGEANYPLAAGRGAVSGKLVFTDALKPEVNASGAWAGLVDPSVADWQFESKFYQYWARADTNGNFIIPHVRPGTYTLHAFNVGAVGEFAASNLTVTAATTNSLGTLTWNIPHAGGYLAWEIGVPDRLATEFRHGTNYWEPYIWDSFAAEFTNPLTYALDFGNPAWDLNYAHNFYGTNVETWSWDLTFTLPAEPPNSNARLTIATAGGESAHLYVYVNGSLRGNFYPPNAGGNTLLRQGVHDKSGVAYVTFNASQFLNAGTNVIRLQQVNASPATGNCTMYDYLALEMPGSVPAVQFSTWQGGVASNRWDAGVTTNWYAYGRTRAFTSGKVLFNDAGDNAPVMLQGAISPASVVVNATHDYNFTGPGYLAGSMPLIKQGPGTLTLTATNFYTGDTRIEGGRVRVAGGGVANASRVLLGASAVLDLNGWSDQTGSLADLNGAGGSVTNSAAAPVTFSLNAASGSNYFSGSLRDGGLGRELTLMKLGAGLQILGGLNAWRGGTVVSNGTLLVARLTGPGLVTVAGGTLGGTGLISGPVLVLAGGRLAPGFSLGALQVLGTVTLAPGSTNWMEINAAEATNDVLAASTLALGGTLVVTNLAGTLSVGDAFKLFTAGTSTGAFASYDLPALPSGAYWDTSGLTTSGLLRVAAVPPPQFGSVSQLADRSLRLSASAIAGQTYVLQAATNLLAPVQWLNIATNTATNAVLDFRDDSPTNHPLRFYRLKLQ